MLVFAYGTLMQGCNNFDLLRQASFVGDYVTPARYTMYNINDTYPGVAPGGQTAITGEVYDINDAILASLDYLEGHPDFYCRREINTPYGKAWCYMLTKDSVKQLYDKKKKPRVIASGNWRKRQNLIFKRYTRTW